MRTRIKVCGMTLPEQVNALDELGVEFAGFIFYPSSPRYVGNRISASGMKKIGGRIARVGVFVNTPYEELLRTVEDYRLDLVQLHGDESPFFCEQVGNYVTVVKAFRMSDNDPLAYTMGSYHLHTDMYLFDTLGAGYGGTGKKFNWKILEETVPEKLYFLSGGIEPADAPQLEAFAHLPAASKLFGLDLNSRFEISPGVKDLDKIKNFINNIKKE